MKNGKKKKVIKSKLFNSVKTKESEKDMLLNFIRVGTDITMLDTTHRTNFMSDFAFKRRTVMDIDGYKILFERYTPEIGYFRHLAYFLRDPKITITKETGDKWIVNVKQDGHTTNYLLENY